MFGGRDNQGYDFYGLAFSRMIYMHVTLRTASDTQDQGTFNKRQYEESMASFLTFCQSGPRALSAIHSLDYGLEP